MDTENCSCDLEFGLMLRGIYLNGNDHISAYLAYNEVWEKYYFERNIGSKNIKFFQSNKEAERFFDMYEREIMRAGDEVFPDREHTNYNVIVFSPSVKETKPLTDIGEPSKEEIAPISYLYIRLYDQNPEVNEVYFIGYNNDHQENEIITTRDFSEVEVFTNMRKAEKFLLDHEEAIRQIADKHRVDGIYKKVDICIMDAVIIPKRIYPKYTIPYTPRPPYHPQPQPPVHH